MISQFAHRGESVSFCHNVVWRCDRSRHLLSFLLCIVSVVLFLSVLSLSCLCFYSCCHLSFCPVYTLSDLANKPPHTCYSVSQMRSLSQIMALLMPQLQVHHWEQRNCCKNSRLIFCGVSVCTCKGGRTRDVFVSIGSPMTWTIAHSEWHCPPWGRADVTFFMPYKGGLHLGNQIRTHIRRQLIWASFLSALCTGRENLELEGKIGSVNLEIT